MSPEENKALVRRFYEEIDRGNLEAMDELVAEDYLDHNPPPFPDLPSGREGLKRAFRMFSAATPGRHEIEEQIPEGDQVVTRLTAYGKHEGDLPGAPRTGNDLRMSAVVIHRIADGKLAEKWSEKDVLGFLQQIGVLPAPAPRPEPPPPDWPRKCRRGDPPPPPRPKPPVLAPEDELTSRSPAPEEAGPEGFREAGDTLAARLRLTHEVEIGFDRAGVGWLDRYVEALRKRTNRPTCAPSRPPSGRSSGGASSRRTAGTGRRSTASGRCGSKAGTRRCRL